jgi:hypothetical protein
VDTRRQEIRVFGSEEEQNELKESILLVVNCLQVVTYSALITCSKFEFILKQGRTAIDRIGIATGATSVSLDISSQNLLVEGTAAMA